MFQPRGKKTPSGFPVGRCRLISKILRPRMILVVALILCWDSRNGTNAEVNHHKNLRLRAPSGYLSQLGQGQKHPQLQEQGIIGSMIPISGSSEEGAVVGPFVGNIAEEIITTPRRKKDCGGMPSIAQRGLVGASLKRSYFAYTPDELDEKLKEQNIREKREVKRNEITEAPLPWTCETKYEWKDMGADHYPRFVRTAECKTRSCFNGFFRCRPRRYKTKVLKRVSPSDSTSCEEDDVSLPESLRPSWRFITVTINLCCDCVGRIPGATEN